MTEIDEKYEENKNPFADVAVIFSYSRAQAIEDGVLIDATQIAKEAGFKCPVAVSEGVFRSIVELPEVASARGESTEGRLWDVVWMCACAARKLQRNHETDTAYFQVLATGDDGKRKLHQLYSKCGPGDGGEPVVTIMLIGED